VLEGLLHLMLPTPTYPHRVHSTYILYTSPIHSTCITRAHVY
jgi:hypothetical protein